jgi:hypothetical protein
VKRILLALTIITLMVVISLTTNEVDALAECDFFKSFENAKSLFGGYV